MILFGKRKAREVREDISCAVDEKQLKLAYVHSHLIYWQGDFENLQNYVRMAKGDSRYGFPVIEQIAQSIAAFENAHTTSLNGAILIPFETELASVIKATASRAGIADQSLSCCIARLAWDGLLDPVIDWLESMEQKTRPS